MELKFVGSSLDDLRNFPEEARRVAGFELRAIQSVHVLKEGAEDG
jgi:phage-related protein